MVYIRDVALFKGIFIYQYTVGICMGKIEKVGISLIVLCILALISIFGTTRYEHYSEYYPVYKATVPFGIFIQSGEIRGSILFVKGSFTESEKYQIKYFKGNEIHTKSLKASKTPLVVSGNFLLEVQFSQSTTKFLWIFERINLPYIVGYKIHIPYLPEVNQTLTEDWR